MFGAGPMAALHIIGLIGRVVFDNFRRVSIVVCKGGGFHKPSGGERGLTSEIAVREAVQGSTDAMRVLSG
jgi:hypothetical protein